LPISLAPPSSLRDRNVHAVRSEKIPRTPRISRAGSLCRGLPSHPAGGTEAFWHRPRRRLHHQPPLPEDGTSPRRLALPEDCNELLERKLLPARPQILADLSRARRPEFHKCFLGGHKEQDLANQPDPVFCFRLIRAIRCFQNRSTMPVDNRTLFCVGPKKRV